MSGAREHLRIEDLLAWIDGEGPWWRRLRTRRHIARCWSCAARVDELREGIAAAGRYRPEWPEAVQTAAARWRVLERIRELEPARRPRRPWGWTLGWAGALPAAVVAMLPLWRPVEPPLPPVPIAGELAMATLARARTVPAPVSAMDVAAGAPCARSLADCVADAPASEAGVREAFAAWLRGRGGSTVSMAAEMEEFALRYRVAVRVTSQGGLTILTAARGTVEFILACDAAGTVRWTEIRRRERAGAALRLAAYVRPRYAAAPVPRARAAPTPGEAPADPAALRHAEIEALCLLNRLGADREEFVEVAAREGAVWIDGAVASASLRAALESEMQTLPAARWIRVRLRSPVPARGVRPTIRLDAASRRTAVEEWLHARHAIPEKALFTLMGTVVDSADRLGSTATVLRRLEARFAALERAGVDEAHRAMARRARAMLVATVRFEAGRVRAALSALGVEADRTAPEGGAAELSALALRLFSSGVEPAGGDPAAALRDLAGLSARVERESSRAEAELAGLL